MLENHYYHGMLVAIVDCPVLYNLSDSMHISSRGQEYGTVVKFTCDTGYLLEGATTLICDINGTWSDSPPVCKSKETF